jgi:hypothetical protein
MLDRLWAPSCLQPAQAAQQLVAECVALCAEAVGGEFEDEVLRMCTRSMAQVLGSAARMDWICAGRDDIRIGCSVIWAIMTIQSTGPQQLQRCIPRYVLVPDMTSS